MHTPKALASNTDSTKDAVASAARHPKLRWVSASVGCHWYADPFTITTRVSIIGGKVCLTFPHSGYALIRDHEEIGLYKTLHAAQRAAEKAS